MPKILNKHKDSYQFGDVYIGRGSKWGNPFSHLKHLGGSIIIVDSREEAIQKYEEWLVNQPQLVEDAKKELRGKNLICYCTPLPCHGEVLIKIANS